MKKMQDMLCEVVRRRAEYEEAAKSEKEVVKECALKMLDINLWELWVLTQPLEN